MNKNHFRLRVFSAAMTLVLTLGPAIGVYAEEAAATEAPAEAAAEAEAPAEATPAEAEPTIPLEELIPTNATEGWPKAENPMADYACLMDADTGAILLNKGMDVQSPPASLTKIMTCLLAIENGDLDAQVTMTKTGVEYAVSGSSNLYTQVGEVFTLKDMLDGVMLKSANDFATQVGEYIGGGSLDTFINMMNERAAELGCTNTHFVNACGMPAEGHVSSARDMALISREALKNETFREIVSTAVYTIPATNMTEERIFQNHHPFITDPEWIYEGTIGGKTGYTDLAKSCLATYVQKDGMTLISVVLHDEDSQAMRADSKKILDYGFDNFTHGRVDLGDAELVSGGVITLPKGAVSEDCTEEMTEGTDADGNAALIYSYSWHGYPVGEAVMAKETFDAVEEEKAAAEAEKAGETETTEEAETTEESGENEEAAEADDKKADAAVEEDREAAADADSVTLPFGITMQRTAFLAIAMLTMLILIGLILVILSALFKKK